jgi:ribonucleoside-diphosphate reductase alpha chain
MSKAASTPSGRPKRKVPRVRRAETTRFTVDDQKGYLTTAANEDGSVGEVTILMAKQGSTLAGVMDALGAAISLGLQAGAPAEVYVSKFSGMRFVPAGRTDDAELPVATSIMDYVARRLALDCLPAQRRMEMGILTAAERRALVDGDASWVDLQGLAMSAPQELHR